MSEPGHVDPAVISVINEESNRLRDDHNISVQKQTELNETLLQSTQLQQKLNDSILAANKDIANISQKQIELQEQQNRSFEINVKKKHLKDLLATITKSDGIVVPELLSFCDSIDLVVKEPECDLSNDDLLWLAKNASKGDLHKEIIEYLALPDNHPWDEVKNHVISVFVGPNALDVFRQQLDTFQQSTTETIPAFNRRFKTLAARAYPTKSDDIDSIILKNYVKAIRDPNIITRLYNGISNPTNVEEAITAVEKIYATLIQLKSIGITLAPDQLEFFPTGQPGMKANVQKQQFDKTTDTVNKHSTELEKCRIQLAQMKEEMAKCKSQCESKINEIRDQSRSSYTRQDNRYMKQNYQKGQANGSGNSYRNNSNRQLDDRNMFKWTDDGRPICHRCKQVGHVQRFCKYTEPPSPKNGVGPL